MQYEIYTQGYKFHTAKIYDLYENTKSCQRVLAILQELGTQKRQRSLQKGFVATADVLKRVFSYKMCF
ncbi:MAG: hypothetical protein EAZ31_08700 [Cytophagia bacterium]|nr:MAG: hypothetical protein EAZ31_08700 [Cytophagia bacterium]